MLYGLFHLSIWGYIAVAFILTHLTVLSVTLYLHRCQAHRSLEMHPALCHFFRFWCWLTTAMGTRVWVSIHRKHHVFAETENDPHSPIVLGLPKVFFGGVWLYRKEAANKETMERYGRGTPDDWLEHNLYDKDVIKNLGLLTMFILDFVLFGLPGVVIWGVQMIWIPLLAAGVINGVGHYWGYRNFECEDASRNIIPLGILAGGEELHNNHHAFGTSAKFSVKWWEFDIGWMYIRLFEMLGLAKVIRTVPQLHEDKSKTAIDNDTLGAILSNRYNVMDQYCRQVVLPVFKERKQRATDKTVGLYRSAKKLLVKDVHIISQEQKDQLKNLLAVDKSLQTIYEFQAKLQDIWHKSSLSQAELLETLKTWCQQAEQTGIKALQDFASHIRYYTNKQQATVSI